jgi:cation transport regulator ChaC
MAVQDEDQDGFVAMMVSYRLEGFPNLKHQPVTVAGFRAKWWPMDIEPKVWVFFYGSYINFDVLREVDLLPSTWEVARLAGFDIKICPRANLIRSDERCVYGIVAKATHAELTRLYAHAREQLGEIYLPEAVLVETSDGALRPALCYICPEMMDRPAEPDYVARIAKPAREYGFPDWYLERLLSFTPTKKD